MQYVMQLALHVASLHDEVTINPLLYKYKVDSIKLKVRATSLDAFVETRKTFDLDGFDKVIISEGLDNLWMGSYRVLVEDLDTVNTVDIYSKIAKELVKALDAKKHQLYAMRSITETFIR